MKMFCVVNIIVLGFHFAFANVYVNETNILVRTRRQYSCKPNEFSCTNGQCISSYDKCDGIKNCEDGSDETAAECNVPGVECGWMSFRCSYGACISENLRCDGKRDCADGSDEDCNTQGSAPTECSNSEYRCTNGQCISGYDICDGVQHCADGSDETSTTCKDNECLDRSFRCTYGACLNLSLQCNGHADCFDRSDELYCTTTPTPPLNQPIGCRLPAQPFNGAYYSTQQCYDNEACSNQPGTQVPTNWELSYTCNYGYILNRDSEVSTCRNGVWENPLECVKPCPPLKSATVNVQCYYENVEVNCSLSMRPDTMARARCKRYYKPTKRVEYDILVCIRSGLWSYGLFECTPECGLSTNEEINKPLVPLITQGAPTRAGEFPWLTAIYRRNASDQWEQQCGGSLITPRIVLTAAHCLVNNNQQNKKLSPDEIKVGLGKYYREYYTREDQAIIASVRIVSIPNQYSGSNSNYAEDIGLLDLTFTVDVTAHIMPVCVDWSYEVRLPPPDAIGVVAGWGMTSDSRGSSSIVALSARLKYVEYGICLRQLQASKKSQLTQDKFCAGDVDGSNVNNGDSGGGLTFVDDGRHYLFGIVSLRLNTIRLSLFTNIKKHLPWLQVEMKKMIAAP